MEFGLKFFGYSCVILLVVSSSLATSIGEEVEKLVQCSKYDFREKVLDIMMRMNLKVEAFDTLMKNCETEFKTGLENIEAKMELFIQGRINDSMNSLVKDKLKDLLVNRNALEADLSFIKNDHPVAFSASLTKTTSVRANHAIKFDKVWTNIQNGYDPSTGVFTAPVDGLYYLICTLVSSGGSFSGVLYKNGNSQSVVSYSLRSLDTGNLHTVLTLNKGDRVDIRRTRHNGDTVYSEFADYFSMFTGFKI